MTTPAANRRTHAARRLMVALVLLVAALRPVWGLGVASADYCADAGDLDLLARINGYRADHGVAPLTPSPTLGGAAWHHALDLPNQGAAPTHTLSDGTTWLQNIYNHGYPNDGTTKGENIGWGFGGDNAAMMAWWEGSPAHNANLLDARWVVVGVKRVSVPGSYWGWYWTLDFGMVVDQAAAVCGPAPTATPAPTPTVGPAPTPAPTSTPGPTPTPKPCRNDHARRCR